MSTAVGTAPASGRLRLATLPRDERKELAAAERALSRVDLTSVLEGLPVRFMVADRTLTIRYLNKTARAELGALVAPLGMTADDLVGMPVSVLNATPGYVDASGHELPFTFQVDNGLDVVDVTVCAIEEDGRFCGTTTTWTSASSRLPPRRSCGRSPPRTPRSTS